MDDRRDVEAVDSRESYEALTQQLAQAEAERRRLEEALEQCRQRLRAAEDAEPAQASAELQAEILQREQAEEAVRAAGTYNRRLIEASLDPLVTIGPDGQITDVNAATEAVTGMPRVRLIGSDFSEYFTEPDRATAGYRQVLAGGLVRDYPLTIRHANGRTTEVLYNATVYRNEAGEVHGVFAAARDITERKQAEAELEKYRAHLEDLVQERTGELEAANVRLQAEIVERQRAEAAAEQRAAELDALFNSIGSGLLLYGPDSRIARINPAGEAMLGYTRAIHDVLYPDRVRRMRIEGLDGRPMPFDHMPAGRAFHGETVHGLPMALYTAGDDQPPTWVMASAAPVRAADGTVLGVVSTFSDVTELRRTQESLEEANERLMEQAEELEVQSEELMVQNRQLTTTTAALDAERARLQAVLERMPAGVAIAEAPSGRLTLYNQEMVRIWRHPLAWTDKVTGLIGAKGFHPDGQPVLPGEWPLARALATGEVVSDEEVEIVRGDGSRGFASIGAAPIRDRSGQVVAAVTVIHDVTDHRELETALGRARDELATLLAISGDMASTLDADALLGIVADRLSQIVPYTGLAVFRLAEGGRVLEVAASRGESEMASQPVPVELAAGLHEVVATRRPVLIPDVLADSPSAPVWLAGADPVQRRLLGRGRCWLGVPLTIQERVIGVLRLTHDEPGRFSARDAELALAYANQAAVAMENARLYEQAKKLAAVEERQRLARDLHDAVSQTLFSAGLIADVLPRLWEQNPDLVRPQLEELKGLTRGARAEMRTLLWELRPETLLQARLDQLLQQLAEAIGARVPIKVTATAQGEGGSLPPDVQVALYRIVQEALNNVVKHAKAEHATICLEWQAGGGGVELRIEDDGCGFDARAVSPERLGLKIMRERAGEIGAKMTVDSRLGAGTIVAVTWSAAGT